MTENDIAHLTQRVVRFRDARDWKQFHNPKDCALSLMLEAAELAEHFQWKNADEMQAHIAKNREDIGDEIADVFYWVLLMSNDLGVNLREALERKMEKNEAKYPQDKAFGSHKKYTEL